MKESAFHIPKKSDNTGRDSRKDTGRSLDLEMKRNWYGNCRYMPEGKWNFIAAQMLERVEETGYPTFTGVSALSRGVLKSRKNKGTIHFTAETSKIELLFRIINSANQLSVYGAVSSWSGQPGPNETEPISEKFVTSEKSVNAETLKSVNSNEISSLVDSAKSMYASRNRAWDDLQDIILVQEPSWVTGICEIAGFWNLVEKGKYYKTHPCLDDGFGGFTPACRKYSRPRQEVGSTVLGAISEGTVIGPAQLFIVAKIMGAFGIDTGIPSPDRPGQNSWIMLCRGMNRFMDEVLLPKSEHNIASRELITEKAVETTEPC